MSIDKKYYIISFYIILCGISLIYINTIFSRNPIVSDATQNLEMAYNLYTHGVLGFGDEASGTLRPTNYREPVPPTVSAIFMQLHPGIQKNASFQSFFQGENTIRIKQVNLLWVFALLTGVGYLIYIVSRNEYAPFLVYLLVMVYFVRFGGGIDSLFTELPGAVLIIWCTVFLVLTVKKQETKLYLLTGLGLGLLILTKAVFFYLYIVIAIFLFVFMESQRRAVKLSLLIFGTLIILAPWVIRNYSIYQEISVTQRGGAQLYIRALKNQIKPNEFKGAVYFWGPKIYKDLVANTVLAANEEDFESGGKYVRLNRGIEKDSIAVELGLPDLAESLYGKSRAEINRLQNALGKNGNEGSRREAFKIMKSEALEMILNKPFKHLALTPLFLWRGIWCFPNSTIPLLNDNTQRYLHNLINLLAYCSLLVLFIYGCITRNSILIAVSILPLSAIFFHALLTHNIPRFTDPAIPSMLVCFSLSCLFVLKKITTRNRITTRFKSRE